MNKIYSFLGLCARARMLVSGETAVIGAVRDGKAHLVILASDASEQTRKRFTDKCSYYGVRTVTFGTMEEIGNAIGKEHRSAVAVTDGGFADEMIKKLETQ